MVPFSKHKLRQAPNIFILFLTNTNSFCNFISVQKFDTMEQHTLKNVNNCLNTNIYYYLETSGGQSSNLYLKVVYFFSTSVN